MKKEANYLLIGLFMLVCMGALRAAPPPAIIVSAQATGMTTGAATVNSTVTLVVAANAASRGKCIQNSSIQTTSVDCWIVSSSNGNTTTGYYLAPGSTLSLSGTEAVYALTASANCTLSYVEEH